MARVAGLLGVAVLGTALGGATYASPDSTWAWASAAGLLIAGGLLGGLLVENPRRVVRAEECPGGALVGATRDAAGCAEACRVGEVERPTAATA